MFIRWGFKGENDVEVEINKIIFGFRWQFTESGYVKWNDITCRKDFEGSEEFFTDEFDLYSTPQEKLIGILGEETTNALNLLVDKFHFYLGERCMFYFYEFIETHKTYKQIKTEVSK